MRAALLHRAGAGWLLGFAHKNRTDIDGIEAVLQAAEVAADLDRATLYDDAIDLGLAERAQHVAHPFARTVAGKARVHRLEAAQVVFPEQSAQQGLGVQRKLLVARKCGGQQRDAV